MRKTVVTLMSVLALVLASAAPAFAHNLTVEHPNTGEVLNVRWVGGDTVPEPAQDAPPMFGPFSLPPSHAHGIVMACQGTADSPAVTFRAPPFFSGCVHGQP